MNSLSELAAELVRRSDRDDLCIQEYIEGADISCSVLVRHGRIEAWTTQRGLRRLRPYAAYSELQMETCEHALTATTRLMRALNWSGVANIDLRIDVRTGEALVLEINGRFWDSLLASTLAGVNFPDLACRMNLGEKIASGRQRSGRYIHPRLFIRDLLRCRRSAFRPGWNGFSFILRDPLPEVCRGLVGGWRALSRLVSAGRPSNETLPSSPKAGNPLRAAEFSSLSP